MALFGWWTILQCNPNIGKLTFLLENKYCFETSMLLFNNWTQQSIHRTMLMTKTAYETEIKLWLIHGGIFRGQIKGTIKMSFSWAMFLSPNLCAAWTSAGQCIALEMCLSISFYLMLYCSPAAFTKWWTPPALSAFPLIACIWPACAESLLLP